MATLRSLPGDTPQKADITKCQWCNKELKPDDNVWDCKGNLGHYFVCDTCHDTAKGGDDMISCPFGKEMVCSGHCALRDKSTDECLIATTALALCRISVTLETLSDTIETIGCDLAKK